MEEEALLGNDYLVDVEIETNFSEAALSDDLSKTADYCLVYEVVKKEMAVRSKLIEQVCWRIHKALHQELKNVQNLKVKLTKLNPPINGPVNSASVEIEG